MNVLLRVGDLYEEAMRRRGETEDVAQPYMARLLFRIVQRRSCQVDEAAFHGILLVVVHVKERPSDDHPETAPCGETLFQEIEVSFAADDGTDSNLVTLAEKSRSCERTENEMIKKTIQPRSHDGTGVAVLEEYIDFR